MYLTAFDHKIKEWDVLCLKCKWVLGSSNNVHHEIKSLYCRVYQAVRGNVGTQTWRDEGLCESILKDWSTSIGWKHSLILSESGDTVTARLITRSSNEDELSRCYKYTHEGFNLALCVKCGILKLMYTSCPEGLILWSSDNSWYILLPASSLSPDNKAHSASFSLKQIKAVRAHFPNGAHD